MREGATKPADAPEAVEHESLRLVPGIYPQDVPHLEAELARAKERTAARWPVEFVMQEVANGRAAAFRIVEGGEHLAWVVVERIKHFEAILNVWVMVGSGLAMHHRDGIVSILDSLARCVGASGWRAEGREGWQRVLHGVASRVFTVYERDVR